jgi:hypothetical protein
MRIGWGAWAAIAAIITREPLALGLTAIGLMIFSRISARVVLAATGSSAVLYLAAGFVPATRYFLLAVVTSLGATQITLRRRPEWWASLEGAMKETRSRLGALGWRERISEAARLLPPVPPRRVRFTAEIAVWILLLVPVAGAVKFSAGIHEGFVATRVGGRTEMKEPGRYRIKGPAGGLEVEFDGARARVIEAGCREKRCVRQGATEDGLIVCVPNRVVIRPLDENAGGIDAWTG